MKTKLEDRTRRQIGRSVTISHCNGQRVVRGLFADFSADLIGNFSEQRATRRLRRDYDDMTIVINNVERETAYYTMPLDEFMTHATKKGD